MSTDNGNITLGFIGFMLVMIKAILYDRTIVYPEDKEYYEPGHRDLSTKPHMGQNDFRVT